jgi:hypothetical protein
LAIDPEDIHIPNPLPLGFTMPPKARATGIAGLQDDWMELVVSKGCKPYTTPGESPEEVQVLVLLSRQTWVFVPLREFILNFPFTNCLDPRYRVWIETGKLPPGGNNKMVYRAMN